MGVWEGSGMDRLLRQMERHTWPWCQAWAVCAEVRRRKKGLWVRASDEPKSWCCHFLAALGNLLSTSETWVPNW